MSKTTMGGDLNLSITDFALITEDDQVFCQKIEKLEVPLCTLQVRHKPHDLDCAAAVWLASQPLEVNFSSDVISQIISFFVVPNAE